AHAIKRAEKNNIKFDFVDSSAISREDFYKKTIEIMEEAKVELIFLAGFMRILSPLFVKKYKNKILNIHPSLLPSFPGANAHKDALNYGAKISGCTVHLVDENVDSGPIIMQASVEINENETEETLSEKILFHEHKLLPKALQLMCSNRLTIEGRKVIINTD
ncbi:MAG: phosphoribosylglycinamide formyltransferase, partial [Candidatus Thermoplasmatota archaeon]|nr:phosphoribosylglycinamide formyltransferase [Candidatus Thermoplasmatota archaeon]